MKRIKLLEFVFLFLLVFAISINLASATLCRGADGYYHNCNYNPEYSHSPYYNNERYNKYSSTNYGHYKEDQKDLTEKYYSTYYKKGYYNGYGDGWDDRGYYDLKNNYRPYQNSWQEYYYIARTNQNMGYWARYWNW